MVVKVPLHISNFTYPTQWLHFCYYLTGIEPSLFENTWTSLLHVSPIHLSNITQLLMADNHASELHFLSGSYGTQSKVDGWWQKHHVWTVINQSRRGYQTLLYKNAYSISYWVDTRGLFRCSIKNQVERKNLLVFHTEDLQPLYFWSSQKWHQPGQIASAPVPTSFFVPLS